jgi:phage baseplate assembly protein gpV
VHPVKQMQTNYTDSGVEYEHAGNTLCIEGEYNSGDVFINEELVGSYTRAFTAGAATITLEDGRVFVAESEAEYERMAQQLLF